MCRQLFLLLTTLIVGGIVTCTEKPSPLCIPGRSEPCTCANNRKGAQVCNGDGSGFGPCVCQSTGKETSAERQQEPPSKEEFPVEERDISDGSIPELSPEGEPESSPEERYGDLLRGEASSEEYALDSPPDVPLERKGETLPEGACQEGEHRLCYTGPAGTKGVGRCKEGSRTCRQGEWGPCVGEIVPSSEVCDGQDNNCDGKVDEGLSCGWALSAGGSDQDYGIDLAVDSAGNVYFTGRYWKKAYFGKTVLTYSSPTTMFVAKVSPQGQYLWIKQIEGSPSCSGSSTTRDQAIALDGKGHLYLAGRVCGRAKFGRISWSARDPRFFVAKMDTTGKVLWVKYPSSGSGHIEGLAVDGKGDIYVAGAYLKQMRVGSFTLQAKGHYDVFVTKLNAAGSFLWAVSAGGTQRDVVKDLAVDSQGKVYVAGYFEGQFGWKTTTLTSRGSHDLFVARLNAAGNLLWAVSAGGLTTDIVLEVALGPAGSALLLGTYKGNATFGQIALSGSGGFVASLSAAGKFLWAKSTDYTAESIDTDTQGNIYLTGGLHGTKTFGALQLTSSGGTDIFLTKLDSTGKHLWAVQAGSTLTFPGENSWKVATDSNGHIYTTGSFIGTASFGTTTLTARSSATGREPDIFLWKLSRP